MLREIEVAAVVHPFDFLEAERTAEVERYVERGARIVRELTGAVLMELEALRRQAEREVPLHTELLPLFEPLHVRARLDEELHLHLLELARTENEVARRDLVPERLADLRDAERHLLAHALLYVQEVHKDALRRFRTQIHDARALLERAHVRLEHQVEIACLRELTGIVRPRLLARLLRAARVFQLVGAETALARLAVHQRIHKAGHVTARFPRARVHQNRRIQPFDVVARTHHRVPPAILDVLLELHTKRTVVPHRARATVDLGGLEDEAAPLAQRHQLVHHVGLRSHRNRRVEVRKGYAARSCHRDRGRSQ